MFTMALEGKFAQLLKYLSYFAISYLDYHPLHTIEVLADYEEGELKLEGIGAGAGAGGMEGEGELTEDSDTTDRIPRAPTTSLNTLTPSPKSIFTSGRSKGGKSKHVMHYSMLNSPWMTEQEMVESNIDEATMQALNERRSHPVRKLVRYLIIKYPNMFGTSIDRIGERLAEIASNPVLMRNLEWKDITTCIRRSDEMHREWMLSASYTGEKDVHLASIRFKRRDVLEPRKAPLPKGALRKNKGNVDYDQVMQDLIKRGPVDPAMVGSETTGKRRGRPPKNRFPLAIYRPQEASEASAEPELTSDLTAEPSRLEQLDEISGHLARLQALVADLMETTPSSSQRPPRQGSSTTDSDLIDTDDTTYIDSLTNPQGPSPAGPTPKKRGRKSALEKKQAKDYSVMTRSMFNMQDELKTIKINRAHA